MTMNFKQQYIPFYEGVFDREDLSMNEAVAYSCIIDRWESSKTRSSFFDVKRTAYYVIYTLEQISVRIHTSIHTAGNVLSRLESKGLIHRVKQYNSPDKIFIADDLRKPYIYHVSSKTECPKMQKLQPNHLILITQSFSSTKDTSDTGQSSKKNYSQHKTRPDNRQLTSKKAKPEVKLVSSHVSNIKLHVMNTLAHTLIHFNGLPTAAVESMVEFSYGEPGRLHHIDSLINKAKSNVRKQMQRQEIAESYTATRFESNTILQETFTITITRILARASRIEVDCFDAFMMRSLINYFEESASAYLQQQRTSLTQSTLQMSVIA